ncbi:putative tyrosine-protein kinase [Apostichopus japonicus]|uniref:Putative tyrosine-protein kinase n=1 Tax=Stichopus japonicus TaxID=307972 RepID=A0A2G8L731_STIJA|nr:putative tyrosine-protein kinase [Apostichopus japonicus]
MKGPHKINATNQEAIIWQDNNAGPNSRPSHRNPPSDGVRAPSCVKPPPLRSPPPPPEGKLCSPNLLCQLHRNILPTSQSSECGGPRETFISHNGSSPQGRRRETQGPRAFSRILSSIRGNEKKEMDRQRRELQKAIQNVPGGGCTEDLQVIDAKQISKGKELGQGEFGTVLEGTWRDSRGHKHSVALKTLLTDHMHTSQQNEFLREAKVMCSLNHKCIVRLLGVCVGPPMMLVQELVGMGSLLEHLLNHPSEIPEGDLRLWAAQITSGMMYLEEKKFVHRDLAARNILLESNEQAKISDFGLSRATGANNDYYRATTGGRWPVKCLWDIPQERWGCTVCTGVHLLRNLLAQFRCLEFGVTLWEMFTYGDQPYGELTGAEVIKRIEAGKRLEKPKAAKETDYEMMMECWSYKAEDRPTFYQLNLSLSKEELYQGFYHAGFGQAPSKRKK